MRLLQLAPLLLLMTTVSESCEIITNVPTSKGRVIDVTCGAELNYTLKLEDGEKVSTLEVFGRQMEDGIKKVLTAERYKKSSNITLKVMTEEQSTEDKDRLQNSYMENFSTVVRLIHDELQLPGRESTSVMMLYQIGMSLHHPSSRKRRNTWQELEKYGHTIDPKIYDYHGPSRNKRCKKGQEGTYKGSEYALEMWLFDQCFGMCGPKCACWKFVCGDCCMHPGCKVHDGVCRERGYLNRWCWTFLSANEYTESLEYDPVSQEYITVRTLHLWGKDC